jgi:hypothetical protein
MIYHYTTTTTTLHTAEFQDKYFTVLLFPCFVKAVCQLYGCRALNKKKKVDYERGVGVLEIKHVFIYFISSGVAAIKIFPTTLFLAYVYDPVGVGFFTKLSATFFPEHFCSISITNGHTVLQKTF